MLVNIVIELVEKGFDWVVLLLVGGIVVVLGVVICCVLFFVLFFVGISGVWIGNLIVFEFY